MWPSFQPREADGTGQSKQGPVKLGDVFAGQGWASRKLKPLWSSSLSSCCPPPVQGPVKQHRAGDGESQTDAGHLAITTHCCHAWTLDSVPFPLHCILLVHDKCSLGIGSQVPDPAGYVTTDQWMVWSLGLGLWAPLPCPATLMEPSTAPGSQQALSAPSPTRGVPRD